MHATLGSLTKAVADAADRYAQLVLVVGPRRSGKTALLRAFAQTSGSTYIPLGSLVAERLLATAPRFRDCKVDEVLKEVCRGGGPFLLDNIELLFDPDLRLDPYRLLVGLARTRTIVAAWPGWLHEGKLVYAAPGHREYRSVSPEDAICLTL